MIHLILELKLHWTANRMIDVIILMVIKSIEIIVVTHPCHNISLSISSQQHHYHHHHYHHQQHLCYVSSTLVQAGWICKVRFLFWVLSHIKTLYYQVWFVFLFETIPKQITRAVQDKRGNNSNTFETVIHMHYMR